MTEQVSNHSSHLEVWNDVERSLLYDYLVRMTGDLERSRTETFEVMQALQKTLRKGASQEELRRLLFRTARNFCADCWFRSPIKLLDQVYLGTNRQEDLQRIEIEIDQLGGIEREMLLLRYRYDFKSQDIAIIIGKPVRQVQAAINQGVLTLRRWQADIDMNQLKQFPLFPLEEFDTATQALDEIMEKIPRPWRRRAHKVMLWLLSLLLILAVIYYFRRDLLENLLNLSRENVKNWSG